MKKLFLLLLFVPFLAACETTSIIGGDVESKKFNPAEPSQYDYYRHNADGTYTELHVQSRRDFPAGFRMEVGDDGSVYFQSGEVSSPSVTRALGEVNRLRGK